ncbi:DNA-methyltransferase [Nocardia farcinica]|uniref:DNA-methyltransferase n=1 Tax=Nocardia farcinica TaxID=37329 RepID=UPI00189301E3|nr:site-specific DNA-methyltransferase [Nocardia farcinica]MBF6188913.1 site-specific DNA-methyltransferase [Nocardia farcinica]MBF6410450.1 site-specific DNA-methyltransferase [Nocardia farcinica]
MSLPRNQILVGDALDRVRELPDASVDCVVTSPPYFRLRNYDHDNQLGLEAHVDEWVAGLHTLLVEVRRVLVPTGTIWLNLGDSYSTKPAEGAGRKSLLLGPERLALQLVDDGWLVRNKIVWAKTNTIPTSVADRLATKHEFIYVLARSPTYFFDLDAIREPHVSHSPKRKASTRPASRKPDRPAWLGPNSDGDRGLAALHAAGLLGHPLGKNPGDVWRLAVSGYRGPHFATFPVSLAQRMVEAGCPERRCSQCRIAYRRPVRRLGAVATRLALRAMCDCDAAGEPGLVLDPFIGSGTTAIAAEALGRDWLGIELNSDYVALATDRIDGERASRRRKEVIHE